MCDGSSALVGKERLSDGLAAGAIVVATSRALGDALGIVGRLQFVILRCGPIEFVDCRRRVVERRSVNPNEPAVLLADAGVENVNAQVDALIETGVLRRLLALTELKFSNSMIEAWWRSLKHQWLFLHSLDSIATIRRLVTFYVHQHNHVLPHSAFRGQTPDEMYFGTGDAVPADLASLAAVARRARGEANRSASCETCPSMNAAA
jgi:Integrase core domain